MRDGVDFVPTNKHVLFGHHFTSVAGAAPIVGPAIAVFWGWVPALIWVVLGTIFAAGVHDFGSIVVSVRNRAQTIGTLTSTVINARSRTLFLLIIFFLLTLVNAVFAVVIGNLFVGNPGAVIPIVVEIPMAIAIGQYIYRTKTSALVPSIVGVILLYALILVGNAYPIEIDNLAAALGMGPRTLWIVLLFAYAFIASRIPVWVLLQPRDYINSHQLFIALGAIFLGLLIGLDRIVAPAVNTSTPEGTPPFFPLLFVTIACGAISGFHSLVASGTTSKQLDKDTDAKYVGYMGALGEGALATGAILATTAGIAAAAVDLDWSELYADFGTASAGATGNFVQGIAGFTSHLGVPVEIGTIFAAVVVISFAATTMDTGVRLQRYIIQEMGQIARPDGPFAWFRNATRNLTTATIIAVAVPLALALVPSSGETEGAGFAFGRLWTLFGTTNQLTAGLALSVIAVWVTREGRNAMAQLIPLTFLLVMTVWALLYNLRGFIQERDWLLAPLDLIILVLALWLAAEAFAGIRRAKAGSTARCHPRTWTPPRVPRARDDGTRDRPATAGRPQLVSWGLGRPSPPRVVRGGAHHAVAGRPATRRPGRGGPLPGRAAAELLRPGRPRRVRHPRADPDARGGGARVAPARGDGPRPRRGDVLLTRSDGSAGSRRVRFIGGKGGVGKTSLATALALELAASGQRTLLVSTDPAHSTADLLAVDLFDEPREVAPLLWAAEIDAERTADAHVRQVREDARRVLSREVLRTVDQQLELARRGAGTLEAALLDRLGRLLVGSEDTYDGVVVDTAPTGHTLRLLALPEQLAAWLEGLVARRSKQRKLDDLASQIGGSVADVDPVLDRLRVRHRQRTALHQLLLDDAVFHQVVIPERLPVAETLRAVAQLETARLHVGAVLVNRVLPDDADGAFLAAQRDQQRHHLAALEAGLVGRQLLRVPHLARDPDGPGDLGPLRDAVRPLVRG